MRSRRHRCCGDRHPLQLTLLKRRVRQTERSIQKRVPPRGRSTGKRNDSEVLMPSRAATMFIAAPATPIAPTRVPPKRLPTDSLRTQREGLVLGWMTGSGQPWAYGDITCGARRATP
jgi:hypothetical protein